ncbi:MAG: DUF4402 domain-containing protein [Proteobacteria bacterium]|nr:DUF4402 domain-containing protein [Pseudomonadota bacterium]
MFMFKSLRGPALAICAALAAMASSNVYAQATETGTANANATIAKPITIVSTDDLDFGVIVPNGTGNGSLDVTISTAGARSIAGDVDGALLGGTIGAAGFKVTGRPNATYAITLPPGAATITAATSAATMSVDTFTESTGSTSGTLVVGGTPGLGEHTFTVGATLTVGETQADDTYTGTFDVIATYN